MFEVILKGPLGPALVLAVALAGCATTPERFYKNPDKVKDTHLCRAFFETKDLEFRRDVASELLSRGFSAEECQSRIQSENVALAVVGVTFGTIAIAATCSNGGCGGGYGGGSYYYDYDCPDFSTWESAQAFYEASGYSDPYRLDADNDGIACEALR